MALALACARSAAWRLHRASAFVQNSGVAGKAVVITVLVACAGLSERALAQENQGTPAQSTAPSGAGDLKALTGTKTRTLQVEQVPACGSAAGGNASRNLEVGENAIELRIEFERGTAILRLEATRRLDELAATLRDSALASERFLIAGHTDSTGSDAINVALSCERAKAVRNYFSERHGIEPARFQVEGFGSMKLLDTQRPTAAVNRRVEVHRLFTRSP